MKRDQLPFTALRGAASHEIRFAWRAPLLAVMLMLVWVGVWYAPTAADMVTIWINSQTYAHGFVVPIISAWLIWRDRDRLRDLSPRPSWSALPLLAGAGFLWLLGEFGAVNAASQFAFVAMLVLAVPAVLGWKVARVMMFPLGFLFFAVPVGDFLLPVMMERTADFTVFAVRASGVPVYREGMQFVIPSGRWSVVEACSGVRYLVASLMTGTLFAYVSYHTAWRRWAFVGAAIIVPIVANWLRAYMIVMIAHLSSNELAVGLDHVFYGWVLFGVVMLLMFWIGSRWREEEVSLPTPAGAVPLMSLTSADAIPRAQRPAQQAGPWAVVWAVMAVTVAWPLISMATRQDDVVRPVSLGVIEVPGWAGESAGTRAFVPRFKEPSAVRDEMLRRGDATVGLYVAYYRGQNFRHKLVSSENVLVPSMGSSWREISAHPRRAVIADSPVVLASTRLRGPEGQELVAWQWYWIDGALTSSDFEAKVRIAWMRLVGRGDDAATVVIHVAQGGREDPNVVLQGFIREAWPQIAAALRQARERR